MVCSGKQDDVVSLTLTFFILDGSITVSSAKKQSLDKLICLILFIEHGNSEEIIHIWAKKRKRLFTTEGINTLSFLRG